MSSSSSSPSRCPTCPMTDSGHYCSRQVSWSGPSGRSPVVFIGAGPGKTEDSTNLPYSGRAGEEFDSTYLSLSGLHRRHVVVDNASKCWDGTDRTPNEKRVLGCAHHHLPALLSRTQPDVVVLMGGVTQRLADTRIRLDMHHGMPQYTTLLGGQWEGWVWPSYEPALGMRETSKMTQLMEDFRNLGKWLNGEWVPPYLLADPEEKTDYRLITSATIGDLRSYLRLDRRYPYLAGDTEKHGSAPWSIQFSHTPGTGRMVRAEEKEALGMLNWWLQEAGTEMVLHNAPQDLDTCEKMGVRPVSFRDTMQESYNLCSFPQGLKALVYRTLGVTMRSWEDVVWPASVEAAVSWMEDARDIASSRPDIISHPLVRGRCVDCGHQHTKGPCKRDGCGCESVRVTFERIEEKPSAMEGILKHVLRYTMSTQEDDDPYNPWDKLVEMREVGLRGKVAGEEEWQWMEEAVGRKVPILGIGNVEIGEAVRYGCLSATSMIQTPTGLISIKEIVDNKYSGEVVSTSPDGHIGPKSVIGWYRVVADREDEAIIWKSIGTETTIGIANGTRYTPDHRLMTDKGWKSIDTIRPGDTLLLPIEELNSVQQQVVYGGILGDASISQRNGGGWGAMRISHCNAQLDYLSWKSQLLGDLSYGVKKSNSPRTIKIAGKSARATQFWSLDTKHHPTFLKLRRECYLPKLIGKRNCPKSVGAWINTIDPLGLAIWYQDDGSIVWKSGDTGRPRFYTLSFSESDCKNICDVLLNKFGLECGMFWMEGWAISINGKSAHAFYELIHQYVHPCMEYKLPRYWRGKFIGTITPFHNGLVKDLVVNVFDNPVSTNRRGFSKTSYCIDVADWHNFCTLGEVAHNCADADMTGRVEGMLEKERGAERWEVDVEDWDQ